MVITRVGTVSRTLILLLQAALVWAAEDYYLAGSREVTPPKVTKKVKPRYTRAAWYNRVQGNVAIEVMISAEGAIENILVLSPLGFGLDEAALSAIRQWQFRPGLKNGEPVRVLAHYELEFRLGRYFDGRAEKRRTEFNKIISTLVGKSVAPRDQALARLHKLAGGKYLPALWLLGKLYEEGRHLPYDQAQAIELWQKAANKNFGPAMYEIGRLHIEGKHLAPDKDKGLALMRDAAVIGSTSAQYYLATSHEKGADVPRDLERSRQLYQLCASAGDDLCQFRLGRLLLQRPDRANYQYLQGLAWLSIAASKGVEEAATLAAAELPKLTDDQRQWVDRLKQRLHRR